MDNQIQDFTLTRFAFPGDRIIGDSQVRSDMVWMGALELHDAAGRSGLGFFFSLFHPLPDLAELSRLFRTELFPAVAGQHPFAWTNRVRRPRGGNIRAAAYGFDQAVEQAMWDLQGKALGLPLYRLLGGTGPRVEAYASDLGFHLSHGQAAALCRQARAMGFTRFKIKVGHPDLAWDLARLGHVVDDVGRGATLMVDANEGWSPKEAIQRLHAYRAEGYAIYWAEDPCLRDDVAGLAEIRRAVPFTLVNSGEYLDLHGKRLLLAGQAVDILNIHGGITQSMRAGWLAAEYGVPVSVGNTPFELGVHIAAALPEVRWMEYSFLNYNHLLEQPVAFQDGAALAPDWPGHGLALSAEARGRWARPRIADDGRPGEAEAPPSPINLAGIA